MAIIRFDPNQPVEIALKYDGGKEVVSRIADAPNQMMYTVCGDDTIYVPLHVAEQITRLGIRRAELFSICKRVIGKATKWEVKRVGDTSTPALPTPIDSTPLERDLTDSVNQQRKALPIKVAPPAAATVPSPLIKEPAQPQSNPTASGHTHVSFAMAASLIAAIDAIKLAEQYAVAKGIPVKPLVVEFLAEDLRAVAATIFIQASKDSSQLAAAVVRNGRVNGGTTWPA